MTLNATPLANRIHIGIFGRRNAGKSSVINAITGQNLAIVSALKGTTTDPVSKSMELLPLGPVVLIDTPGLDDEGELGELRIRKALQTLNKTDIALLVIDGTSEIHETDFTLLNLFHQKQIPYIIVLNKADLWMKPSLISSDTLDSVSLPFRWKKVFADKQLSKEQIIPISTLQNFHIHELKERIASLIPKTENRRRIVGDLISPGDFVVLVVPIDKAAPKGRLILPQQQTIRDILDSNAISIVTKDSDLRQTLKQLGKKPTLVITDSQVFASVAKEVPPEIPLTSFSILFARYKGCLDICVNGAYTLDSLSDGDTILISEGCTHHRQCDDIGTVKLPRRISEYTRKKLNFEFTSGKEFPDELNKYHLIIHCGGCMLNDKEMNYRMQCACDSQIPFTNYGTALAHLQGILKRSLPFTDNERLTNINF